MICVKNSKGFTLIEIIIIIVILSILAAVAVVKYIDLGRDAADGVSESILGTLRSSNSMIHSSRILSNNTATYTMGDVAGNANIQGAVYNVSGDRTLDVTIKSYTYIYTMDTFGQAPTTLPKINFGTGSGCFIATAAYGSYLDPHVIALREFRDRYLLTNRIGTIFVEFYYRYSPLAASFIIKDCRLRILSRFMLTPLVYAVKFPFLFLLLFLSSLISGFVLSLKIRRY
ncbi:MAG: prepilin-type N-terminal cleavage/methylation domain-containing protein [Proteobacteria bacterium]|nr:prepilin-type N-terminal cleavage/methylation domain-containing protein [Pseudomonadota bacterium]